MLGFHCSSQKLKAAIIAATGNLRYIVVDHHTEKPLFSHSATENKRSASRHPPDSAPGQRAGPSLPEFHNICPNKG